MTISNVAMPMFLQVRAGQRFLSEMWLAHWGVFVCVCVCKRGGVNAYSGLIKKRKKKEN